MREGNVERGGEGERGVFISHTARRTGRRSGHKRIGDAAMQVLGGKMGEASAPQPQRTASLV
jgi:hypothetical protein